MPHRCVKAQRAPMLVHDDFISKPFEEEELRARIDVGKRTISLQQKLVKALVENEGLLESISSAV